MHTGYTSEYGVDKSGKDEDEEMMATWIMDGFFNFLI
jgi:hypothetical protein